MSAKVAETPSLIARLSGGGRVKIVLVVLLIGASVGLWATFRRGAAASAPAADVGVRGALAAYLSERAGLEVTADRVGFLSDPQARSWTETLDFAPAWVLARSRSTDDVLEAEDLFYVEVRLDADGSPLDHRRLTNLTRTPYARETLIAQQDGHLALAVESSGQLDSLLMVDFGQDERELPPFSGRFARLKHEVTNVQETGRADGVGLRLYRLEPPASAVVGQMVEGAFEVELRGEGKGEGGEGAVQRFSVPLAGDAVKGLDGAPASRFVYQPRFYAAKMFTPWLVDTIRDLSFVGPRKIAVLEQFTFQWADQIKQWAFAAGAVSEEGKLVEELGEAVVNGSVPKLAVSDEQRTDEWPPPPVVSAVDDPKPGEGQWSPFELDWLRTTPGAPPAFLKTAVRMDAARPYQIIVLIAMDMRQLDLGMVAGTGSPESTFGVQGTGQLPRDRKTMEHLVAAFNGGFKTAHGAYGMQVDGQIVLPAMPFAATVAVTEDRQVQLGSWNNSMQVPPQIRSFRQNLPPLIADGKLNPTGKRQWGGTASDLDSVYTERSGVCFRGENTLVFAWGQGMSADSLGKAMLAAGCDFGLHLDMNPTHTGWSFLRVEWEDVADGKLNDAKIEKGGKTMDFRADRYLERDVKDFFYLTLRSTFVDDLPAPPEGFGAWTQEHAPRNTEGFLELAAVSTGPKGEILVAADLEHLTAKLQRGSHEPDPNALPGAVVEIEPVSLAAPSMLLDLGVTSAEEAGGLKSGATVLKPLAPGQAALVRTEDGRLDLLPPATVAKLDLSTVTDARGGQALIVDGERRPWEGPAPKGWTHVMGLDAARRLFVVSGQRSPDQLAELLHGLGARQAMALSSSLGATEHPLHFLRVDKGDDGVAALREVTPATGKASPLAESRATTTHLYFERVAAGPRVTRLDLPTVELDAEEAKRQKRLLSQVNAMREELRSVENEKYKVWVEKLKEKREAKEQK